MLTPFRAALALAAMNLLAVALIVLMIVVMAANLRAEAPCLGELVTRWNRFAADANAYVQTQDADPARRARKRAALDREWRELGACPCW